MNEVSRWWNVREALFSRDFFFDEFFNMKNDSDRVKFILEYLLKYEKPLDIPQEFKSAEIASEHIERASKNLESQPWQSLLEIYTEGVIYAQPDSNELAQAYANRSAVLYNGGLYSDSRVDIERALNSGYLDDLKIILYARREKCILATNKKLNFEFNKGETDETDADNILYELPINSLPDRPFKKVDCVQFLPVVAQDNPKIMQASAAIELEFSKKFGRKVMATRNIEAGEVLLVHKTYASIIEPHHMHKYCWHCSKRVWSGVPCHQCVSVIYCNESCRDEAWQEHHDVECSVIAAMLGAKMAVVDMMSLRLTVKAYKEAGTFEILRGNLDKINAIRDPIAKCFSGNVFDNTKYASVYSLWRTINDICAHAFKASIILYFLAATTTVFGKKIENFEELLDNEWTVFIGGLILRHVEISIMNCVTMCIDDDDDNSIDRGGILNPFISLFNHNCDPMVVHYVCGDMNAIISLQKIQKGEQIFYDYGSSFWDELTNQRRNSLLEKFGFLCECKACVHNWGPHTRLFLPSRVMKSWPAAIEKRLTRIRTKYPSIMSMARADIAYKPLIISTIFNMMNVYQRSIKYRTKEMFEFKALVHELYYSARC